MAESNADEPEIPEDGGSVSFERVELYLERHPDKQEFSKIDYDDGYVGEDWPHRGYALARKDIEQILEDANTAEAERGEVQEALNNLLEQKKEWVKHKAQVQALNDLVLSMRLHGARHHFNYGYQKYDAEARVFVDHCKVCDKDKGHPAHFAQGSRYLDSREVEKQAVATLKRVVELLEGQGFKPLLAQNTARELLKDLPGIPPPITTEEGS